MPSHGDPLTLLWRPIHLLIVLSQAANPPFCISMMAKAAKGFRLGWYANTHEILICDVRRLDCRKHFLPDDGEVAKARPQSLQWVGFWLNFFLDRQGRFLGLS